MEQSLARPHCEERRNPVSEAEQHFHLQRMVPMLQKSSLLSASIKAAHGRDALKFMSLYSV